MMDQFKGMSPSEQKQFIDRMKSRGVDTTELEKLQAASAPKPAAPPAKYGAKYGSVSGETIDALFAPLPPVESTGRVWLYADKQLKPVRIRLGISDGTFTQLLSGDLQMGTEVVTGVILPNQSRNTAAAPGAGNPLLPQGGRGRGFGGPGGRGR